MKKFALFLAITGVALGCKPRASSSEAKAISEEYSPDANTKIYLSVAKVNDSVRYTRTDCTTECGQPVVRSIPWSEYKCKVQHYQKSSPSAVARILVNMDSEDLFEIKTGFATKENNYTEPAFVKVDGEYKEVRKEDSQELWVVSQLYLYGFIRSLERPVPSCAEDPQNMDALNKECCSVSLDSVLPAGN